MWNPTHVEVTVSRARNLKAKGKSGTNDAYVTIKLGKEKFQTTLRERAKDPEWHEQCQFSISEKHSLVKLKVFHRNLIGQDDFLGYVEIPLDPSLVYERPQSKWYNLRNRPGDKGPEKCRGEIEVFITYVVQSISGSHISLNMIEQSKKHLSLKRLASPFEKLHMKGSLKKNRGQLSDSSFHLGNVDSDCEQGSSTLPSSDRKAPVDGTVAGCVREEVDSVSEHQVLRDEKHPSKSSVFKFPFASKKKRLQKTSLLSQSTLVLPPVRLRSEDDGLESPVSMKSAGNEFGTAKEVSKHPPSESSSGFGSRRVSASESQSSSGESFTQEKESSTAASLSHDIPSALEDSTASSEVKEGSTQEVIIGPEDEMLRLEASESLKDGDASIPLTPVHEDETVSTTADVREDEQKQRKGPLPDHQEILLPSVETENIPEPDFDGIEDNEVMQVKSAENLPAVITEEEEPQLITGDDAITGLNISRSVTESVQSELDLSSPALQYASSDVSEYFTNQTPHRLQSELSVSTQQPTSVLKSDSASFSDSPDLDLGASEPAKPVLQSVGTISDSSDPKLEILTRESVFEDASCDSEAPVSGQLAPVSDTLLLKTNVTFTEVKSLNNKSRNRNDECKGTTDNVTPAVISSTVASLGQPVQQTAGSWREVETKKRSEPQRSESHKQLSMERGEEVIPSAQTLLLPEEILQQFHHYSRDDLIQIILDQRRLLREKEAYIQDLQSYIDNLLVKVIDIQPRLLMTSESCSSSGSTTAAFHISSTKSGKLHPSSDWRESDSKTTDAHVTYKTATDAVSSVTVTASPKVAAPRKLGFRNPFKAKK